MAVQHGRGGRQASADQDQQAPRETQGQTRGQGREQTRDQSRSQQQDYQQAGSQQQGRAQQSRGAQSEGSIQSRGGQQPDLMGAITPAITEVRNFIEGNPVRAAAVGAVAGAVIMSVVASERGRSFFKMALSYGNPLITRYAREFASKAAGDFAENAFVQ